MSKQKIIVITCGNRGIGKEIAIQLANLGHHVIIGCRNTKQGELVASSLRAEGKNIECRHLDIKSPVSIHDFAESLYIDFNHIDVLINNAAIFTDAPRHLSGADMNIIREIMDVNLFGPIELTKTLLNLVKGSDEGRIINMSSEMGSINNTMSGYPGYRMSKAGLNVMTKILGDELEDTSIKVNSVCPGWVKTEMGGAGATRSVQQGADTAIWLATADEIPSGKFLHDRREREW